MCASIIGSPRSHEASAMKAVVSRVFDFARYNVRHQQPLTTMLRSRTLRQNACSSENIHGLQSIPQDAIPSPSELREMPKPSGPRRINIHRPQSAKRLSSLKATCYVIFGCSLLGLSFYGCWLLNSRLNTFPALKTSEAASRITQPVLQVLGDIEQTISSAKFRTHPLADSQHPLGLVDEPERRKANKDLRNSRWPPIVTAVPEVPPSHDATRIGVTTASVDSQFCFGRPKCRMLLPLWIGEQESRGRMHLTQLVHLASSLNRTLVLPNVSKSRLGTCGKWSFEAYYDPGSIAAQMEEVSAGSGRIMLMDDFKTWVDMRPDGPTGQLLFLQEDLSLTSEGTLLSSQDGLSLFVDHRTLELNDRRLKNAYCLKTKYRGIRLDAHYPLSLYLTAPDPTFPAVTASGDLVTELIVRPDTVEKSISKELVDEAYAGNADAPPSEPDILLVHWDLRHMPFATLETLAPLEYSEKLWQLSRRLIRPHQPFLAVHWRMETVEPALLPDCAEALVDSLSMLLADPTLGDGIKTIWLATDVPWASTGADPLLRTPMQRSNTFKAFTKEHFEAIEIVKAAFGEEGPLEGWRLTGLGEEIQKLRLANKEDDLILAHEDDTGMLWEDSGIWGILDKTAAMSSALFVSGARGCGRVSSFTRQIVDYRTRQQGENAPRNVVELFG